ncbi:MAG: TolC family protein [Sphingomonadales bacterium]|nr:TolC family protein [Sphingomonadales bacterium]
MTRHASTLLAPLALAACTAGPDYHPAPAPLPQHWQSAPAAVLPDSGDWWRSLGDPALDALVTRALAANPDIGQALARIDQARAQAGMARASQLPAAEITGTVARTRQSLEGGLGQISRYVPGYERMASDAQLGLAARWELDLAGGQRRERQAALAMLDGAHAGADAARLTVAGAVAETWVRLRAAEARLALLEERRAQMVQRRAIMAVRVGEGEAAPAALEQTDAALAGFDAAVPVLRAVADTLRHRLAILAGLPVGSALPELARPATLGFVGNGFYTPLPADPAAGLPATILRRRPDLRLAEARAVAANARIGQALAEWWPQLSLAGLAGFDSTRLGAFGSDPSSVVTGAAGLRWRLLDFGRVQAQVDAARGGAREALEAYRGAVLAAGTDVEDAFTLLAARRGEASARATALQSTRNAFTRSAAAAREGEISRDALAEQRMALLVAEDEAVAARAEAWLALIAAYRAIGG